MTKNMWLGNAIVGALAICVVVFISPGVIVVAAEPATQAATHIRDGDAAYGRGDYAQAIWNYRQAIRAQRMAGTERADTYTKLAIAELDSATETPNISPARRFLLFKQGRDHLLSALAIDPNFLPARQKLAKVEWERALRDSARAADFIEQADKLLELLDDGAKKAETYYRRGQAHTMAAWGAEDRSHFDTALADFDRAIALVPDNTDYWLKGKARLLLLAKGLIGKDMTPDAEATILEAIERNPQEVQLYVDYSNLLIRLDRQDEALAQVKKAIEVAPDNPLGWLAQANYYLAAGRMEDALASLAKAEKVDPTDYRIYRSRAFILRRLKRLTDATDAVRRGVEAVAVLQEAAEDAQEGRLRQRELAQAFVKLNIDLADNLMNEVELVKGLSAKQRQPRIDEAKECLARADALTGDVRDTPRRSKILGRLALARGDTKEALRRLREAYDGFARQDTFEPQTGVLLVGIYTRLGQWRQAEEILAAFVAKGYGDSPQILLAQTNVYVHYRHYGKAERTIQRVLTADPNNQQAQDLLILIRARRGKMERLPEGGEPPAALIAAMISQAETKWFEGQRDEALAMAEHLHERAPGNISVLLRVLAMYMKLERRDDARALLEKAIEANPDNKELADQLRIFGLPDDAARLAARLDIADTMQDPYRRAVKKATIYLIDGDLATYAHWLDEAIKLAPDSDKPRLVERLFKAGIGRKDWELAERCVQMARDGDMDKVGGRLFSAQLSLHRGRLDQAVTTLEGVLAGNPQSTTARMLLGECYLRRGDLAGAAAQFTAIYEADKGFAPAAIQMVKVSIARQDSGAWQTWVQRAHRLAPRNTYVRAQYLAMLEQWGDDPDKLIEQRLAILQDSPGDLDNRFRLGRQYLRAGQLDKAEEMFRSVYDRSTSKVKAATVLIQFYYKTGRTAGVDALVSDLLAAAQTAEAKVNVFLMYAQAVQPHDGDLALRILDQAVQADPADPRPHWGRARLLTKQGRPGEAVPAMETVIKLRPDDAAAARELAGIYIQAGRFDEAWAKLQGLPANVKTLGLRSLLLRKQGDLPGALAQLKDALAMADSPRDRLAVFLAIGQTAYLMKDFEQSEKAYLAALKIDRRNLLALNNLAYQYVEKMDAPAKALPLARAAARIMPDDPSAQDTLGWTLAKLGKHSDAVDHLQRAVKVAPSPAKHYHLGYVLEQLDRTGEALQQYQAARVLLGEDAESDVAKAVAAGIERLTD